VRRTPSSQSVVPQEVSFDAHLTGSRRNNSSRTLSFITGERRKGLGWGGGVGDPGGPPDMTGKYGGRLREALSLGNVARSA
jgi:hypothetical protein